MNPLADMTSSQPMPHAWDAASEADLHDAARALAQGSVIIAPTESSYCLAASPHHAAALAYIRELKSREESLGKPLLLLCASVDQARSLAVFDGRAERLAAAWTAPLTLVLRPRDAGLAKALGSDAIALRVPDHEAARRLAELGGPYTGTSANLAGEPPILDPLQAASLSLRPGLLAGVIDAGRLPGGPPSTLVDVRCEQIVILRRGAFPADRVIASVRE